MAAWQILALPEDFPAGSFQARGAEAPKVDVDPARFNHRGRRRVRVHRGAVAKRLGVVAVKNFFVEANFPCLLIHADDEEVMAIFSGSRQPNLAAHDHGGAPALVRDRCFPFNVVCLAPMQRKAESFSPGGNMAVASRPAVLRPIRAKLQSTPCEY